ncbi:MAG: cytochrome c oxidase subunit II [Actinomycetota bacterium]|nr:cytochrome c oxidase subunit II [Actinomycetota bacterium]
MGHPRTASAAALVALGTVTGCAGEDIAGEPEWLGLPDPASSSAPEMGALWIGAWIAAGLVGVVVWGLIIWAPIRYRRRRDDEIPVQVRYNLPVEVLYTAVPFVIIFVLFFHTVRTQDVVLSEQGPPDYEILVVGQQWSWTFNHLGPDGRDAANAAEPNDVFEVGTPADFPTLVLPVNRRVRFELESPDVIHSFWIPAYYFKIDVIPGRNNFWTVTPTVEGNFQGRCAELCGLAHSRMLFEVNVVSEEEYQAHLADLAAQGNTGIATGAGEASGEVAGLDTDTEEGGP